MHSIEPWILFNNPSEVWKAQPTFLIAEGAFFLLLLLCTIHSLQHGNRHGVLWFACLLGGSAIELLTILEKDNIGNFYHSQATVMLFGAREPAYMLLGCYGWIQYVCVALPWQIGIKSRIVEAMLAGLMCSYVWAVLDVVGLKNLWWTWHNDEPLYRDREFGVPVASTFWITSSTASLSLVVRIITDLTPRLSQYKVLQLLFGAISGPLAAVVVMQIPFTIIYHPLVTYAGHHASLSMVVARGVCWLFVILTLTRSGAKVRLGLPSLNSVFSQVVFVFIPFIAVVLYVYGPHTASIVRTSFSQPFGTDQTATEQSFWGAFVRQSFVTAQGVSAERDMYTFDCVSNPGSSVASPPAGVIVPESTWYSVCGTPSDAEWTANALRLLAFVFGTTCLCQFVRVAAPAVAPTKQGKKKDA